MLDIDKKSDDNVINSDIPVNYLSITEAAKKLGVSERTVYRRIDRGEIPTVMVGDKRMILAHALTPASDVEHSQIKALEAEVDRLRDEVSQLKAELGRKDRKLDEKDEDLRRKDEQLAEASHRHDTVVMQMTRLLEYHQQPFWRKLFGRKALPPPADETIVDMEPGGDKAKE